MKRKAVASTGAEPNAKVRLVRDDGKSDEDSESSSSGESSVHSSRYTALKPGYKGDFDEDSDSGDDDDESEGAEEPQLSIPEPLPERIKISRSKASSSLSAASKPAPSLPPANPSSSVDDFAELGISPALVRALDIMSIRRPTPVQAACIPSLLAGESLSSAR